MQPRVVAVLIVMVLIGLVAEVALRIPTVAAAFPQAFPMVSAIEQEIMRQATAGDHAYVPDPELGDRHPPLRHDTISTPDYTYVAKTDSTGFPNHEPWPTRVDVGILGNSLAEAPGVGLDQAFSHGVSDGLGGAPVLNLGLGGGSPEHQLRIYRRYLRPQQPRVVVSTLWVASDLDNAVQFNAWLATDRKTDFWPFRANYGVRQRSKRKGAAASHFFTQHVRLIGTARVVRASVARRCELCAEEVSFPNGDTIYLSVRLQRQLALGLRRPELPTLPEFFFGPLVQLRDEVERDGGRFVVALLPSKEELYGADRFPAVLRTIDAVKAGLDSAGVPSIDLYPVVRQGAGEKSPFFRRDIHFNALGNQLVTKGIVDWIQSAESAARTAAHDKPNATRRPARHPVLIRALSDRVRPSRDLLE